MRRSVFAKVVAIMMLMAAALMLIVVAFFGLIVSPSLNRSFDRVLEAYASLVASTSPTEEEARDIAAQLDIDLRYEGPGGTWSTRSRLPSVADMRARGIERSNAFLPRREYQLVDAPQGGTYLVAWSLGGHMFEAHAALLVMLLLVMVGVIVAAHLVLRRLLGPLRDLNEAVARLGAGQLDVQVAGTAPDEFGRLAGAFNQMVGRVRGMIQARDQLLVDVSHELRSPLTRLKVALELYASDEERRRLSGDVAEMERMITELLELERLRSGHGLTRSRQDLLPLVREVVDSFAGRRPGVQVGADVPEVVVSVDGGKVRTVLRNLLENALKYSLPDSRPVRLSVELESGAVVVGVTDDGIGIPAGDEERVFEPFYRVDPSRSKETGGYGLGLSICKRVMEAHGGTITVTRAAGRGVTFSLRFPL